MRNEEFRNADALIVIELNFENVKLKTITVVPHNCFNL